MSGGSAINASVLFCGFIVAGSAIIADRWGTTDLGALAAAMLAFFGSERMSPRSGAVSGAECAWAI